MTEIKRVIKRVSLKDDDVIQVGDHYRYRGVMSGRPPFQRGDTAGDLVGRHAQMRVPWPPKEEPIVAETTPEFECIRCCCRPASEGIALCQACTDDAMSAEPFVVASSCRYCDEPDDDSMGRVERETGLVNWNRKDEKYEHETVADSAHARCAQAASRLQTPEPEPLLCDVQHEDFV